MLVSTAADETCRVYVKLSCDVCKRHLVTSTVCMKYLRDERNQKNIWDWELLGETKLIDMLHIYIIVDVFCPSKPVHATWVICDTDCT